LPAERPAAQTVRRPGVVAALASALVLVLASAPVAAVLGPARPAGAQPVPPPVSLPDPQPSPEEARQAADDILARPEYQEPDPSIPERVADRIGEWLDELNLPPPTAGLASIEAGWASALAWLVVAVLVVVVFVILSRLRPSRRRRRAREDPLTLSETEIDRDPGMWRSEAERCEREGRWKDALRCRFRALIGQLIDRGVVRDLPGRTSGEFRVEVGRTAPDLAGDFAEASYLFDDAWYGDLPTGPSENAAFRQLADRVLAGGRGTPALAGAQASGADS
jgi:hypothetical protein